MSEISVKAEGICKRYKSFFGKSSEVLKDISLDIRSDEIFGILGPNGSGKTTLISIFSTLIYPERGSLRVLDLDPRNDKDAIRKQINHKHCEAEFSLEPYCQREPEALRHALRDVRLGP